jgi:hypothetical protein
LVRLVGFVEVGRTDDEVRHRLELGRHDEKARSVRQL